MHLCSQNKKIILQEISTVPNTMRRILHIWDVFLVLTFFFFFPYLCLLNLSSSSLQPFFLYLDLVHAQWMYRTIILFVQFIVTSTILCHNIAFYSARSSVTHCTMFSMFTALYRGLFFSFCQNTLVK